MAEHDKWEVTGVLPGEYEQYGPWIIQKGDELLKQTGRGVIYHIHPHINKNPTLYLVSMHEGKCRKCGKKAPQGAVFRARTIRLDNV